MDNVLNKELINYKELTESLLRTVEGGNYDALEDIFASRQKVIDNINLLEYSGSCFSEICLELDMLRLEERLGKLLNLKKNEIKSKINKLSEQKQANRSYNNKFSVDSIYFNKRI